MWRSRAKSTVKVHDTTSPTSPFSFSTFKDIQYLCTDDYPLSSDSLSPSPTSSPSQTTFSPSLRRSSSIFHRVRLANSLLRSLQPPRCPPPQPGPYVKTPPSPQSPLPSVSFPGAEDRIVIYFTSLRIVRSTFEDCKTARSILRGFRVTMDERDLSMDSSFLNELHQIFYPDQPAVGSKLTLPRVFIGGRYMGGAEEIRQLHETGKLKKIIEGLPEAETDVCEVCGGHGFVLCDNCNGSHKLYIDKTGFKTCTACNENGLIRCPSRPCSIVSL